MKHGIGGYSAGCRCDGCRVAKKESRSRYQYRSVPEGQHGTLNARCNYKCNCDLCKKVWAEYTRPKSLKAANRRLSVLRLVKWSAGCIDCGFDIHPEALDFDHVQGEKKFNLSKPSRSWKLIWEEVMKCEIRCANCHRIITAKRREEA